MRYLTVVLLLCTSYAAAQNHEPNWVMEPMLDSISQECLTQKSFVFVASGKKGYYSLEKMRVIVPAEYDEVKTFPDRIAGDSVAVTYRYFFVKKKGLYGVYSPAGYEVLKCLYTRIELLDHRRLKVNKGNMYAVYDLANNDFETVFAKEGTKAAKIPKVAPGKSPYPPYEHLELRVEDVDEAAPPIPRKAPVTESIQDADAAYAPVDGTSDNRSAGDQVEGYTIVDRLSGNLVSVRSRSSKDVGLYNLSDKKLVLPLDMKWLSDYGKYILGNDRQDKYTIVDTSTGKVLLEKFRQISVSDHPLAYNNPLLALYTRVEHPGGQALMDKAYNMIIGPGYAVLELGLHNDLVICHAMDGRKAYYNLIRREFITGFDSVVYVSGYIPPVIIYRGEYLSYDITTGATTGLGIKKVVQWLYNDSFAIVDHKKKVLLFNLKTNMPVSGEYEFLAVPELRTTNSSDLPGSQLLVKYNRILPKEPKGILSYSRDGKYGLIRTDGMVLLEPIYDSLYAFTEHNTSHISDPLYTYIFLFSGGKMTLFNLHTMKKEAEHITAFQKVKKWNYTESYDYWYKSNGRWGYAGISERAASLPPLYDTFHPYVNMYVLKQGSKFRVFARQSAKVHDTLNTMTPVYDSLWIADHYIHARIGKKLGLINEYYDHIEIPVRYNEVKIVHKPYGNDSTFHFIAFRLGNLWGYKFRGEFGYTILPFSQGYKKGSNGVIWVKYKGKWGILSEEHYRFSG